MNHSQPPIREDVTYLRDGERLFVHALGIDGLPHGRLLAIIEPGPGVDGLVLRTRDASIPVRDAEEAMRLLVLPYSAPRHIREADDDER